MPQCVCVNRHINNNNNGLMNHFIVGTEQSQIMIIDVRQEDNKQSIVQTLGSQGDQPGQFNSQVYGISLDENNNLWTTDHGNHRIQKFINQRMLQMSTFLMGERIIK